MIGHYLSILIWTFSKFQTIALPPNLTRALNTGNPELVEAYNASLLQYYTEHRMVERITELHEQYHQMPREELRAALVKWDSDQGQPMAMGEKRLHTPPRKCKWSPILRNLAKPRMHFLYQSLQSVDSVLKERTRWLSSIRCHLSVPTGNGPTRPDLGNSC